MKERRLVSLSVLNIITLLICVGCYATQATEEHPQGSTETHIAPPQNVMVPPLAVDDSSITLIWSKPKEYANVASYNVYQEGSLAGNTKKLFFIAEELIEPNHPYSF